MKDEVGKELTTIFSFNYLRHVLAMAYPAIAMLAALFVERIGVWLIGTRWVVNLIEILLLIGVVILWGAILSAQKKAILQSVQAYLGSKNVAAYQVIRKSLYITRFMWFSVNDTVLEEIKKPNAETEYAITQVKGIALLSTIALFGSMMGAALLVTLFINLF